MKLGRRRFLAAAGAAPLAAQHAPPASGSGSSVEQGEPYELLGNRLYFTNWFYIRPGTFTWKDEKGASVGLKSEVPAGAAHLTHTDQPHGIRLVAQRAERIGPLITADRPWEEGPGLALTTVIKDGGMFRGWGG